MQKFEALIQDADVRREAVYCGFKCTFVNNDYNIPIFKSSFFTVDSIEAALLVNYQKNTSIDLQHI